MDKFILLLCVSAVFRTAFSSKNVHSEDDIGAPIHEQRGWGQCVGDHDCQTQCQAGGRKQNGCCIKTPPTGRGIPGTCQCCGYGEVCDQKETQPQRDLLRGGWGGWNGETKKGRCQCNEDACTSFCSVMNSTTDPCCVASRNAEGFHSVCECCQDGTLCNKQKGKCEVVPCDVTACNALCGVCDDVAGCLKNQYCPDKTCPQNGKCDCGTCSCSGQFTTPCCGSDDGVPFSSTTGFACECCSPGLTCVQNSMMMKSSSAFAINNRTASATCTCDKEDCFNFADQHGGCGVCSDDGKTCRLDGACPCSTDDVCISAFGTPCAVCKEGSCAVSGSPCCNNDKCICCQKGRCLAVGSNDPACTCGVDEDCRKAGSFAPCGNCDDMGVCFATTYVLCADGSCQVDASSCPPVVPTCNLTDCNSQCGVCDDVSLSCLPYYCPDNSCPDNSPQSAKCDCSTCLNTCLDQDASSVPCCGSDGVAFSSSVGFICECCSGGLTCVQDSMKSSNSSTNRAASATCLCTTESCGDITYPECRGCHNGVCHQYIVVPPDQNDPGFCT